MDTYKKVYLLIALLASSFCLGSAGDIVHHDDVAPKRPGCENNFVLVKLQRKIPNFTSKIFFQFFFVDFCLDAEKLKR
jgi:hypothetical protein